MPLVPFNNQPLQDELYQFEDGTFWQVVGYIDRPQYILQKIGSDEQRHEVIGCPNAERWTKFEKQH